MEDLRIKWTKVPQARGATGFAGVVGWFRSKNLMDWISQLLTIIKDRWYFSMNCWGAGEYSTLSKWIRGLGNMRKRTRLQWEVGECAGVVIDLVADFTIGSFGENWNWAEEDVAEGRWADSNLPFIMQVLINSARPIFAKRGYQHKIVRG